MNARNVGKPLFVTIHLYTMKGFTVERNPMNPRNIGKPHVVVHFNVIKEFTVERNPMNANNVEGPCIH
jgi:hypothetical protein